MMHLQRWKFAPGRTAALVALAMVLGWPAAGADSAATKSPSSPAAPSALQPTNLRCEYAQNPVGVDVIRPQLSWGLEARERNQKQSAYHVLVATHAGAAGSEPGRLVGLGSGQVQRVRACDL